MAKYVITGDQIVVEEHPFSELVPGDDLTSYQAPFSIALGRKDKRKFEEYLCDLLQSFISNKKPYAPELFGTAARNAALLAEAAEVEQAIEQNVPLTTTPGYPSPVVAHANSATDRHSGEGMVTQLERLFELHKAGAFTEEEYAAAKAKLLE